MAKFNFRMGITLRCYGNVEIDAESVEAALPMLTADFVGENIDITETTTDSGQDLAVIDVSDAETDDDLSGWDGHQLPSPYDLKPDAELLIMLQMAVPALEWCEEQWANSLQHGDGINVLSAVRATIAKWEGRANDIAEIEAIS